ncbi:MAG: protein kinase [Clostridiales bacterium]|nr:protein kinase [Roseburia sp.]MDD7636123.1 protein kinase [Clostridiales bacterium]MDY4112242.1 protein kinase [Roseburia sp.]
MLGSGSSSTVYLAEHLKLKIFRAIKRIPKCLTEKSSLSQEVDFPQEADLLKNLNHPGIPLIYDIDEDDDYIYMIEEFIQGESLDTYVLHQRDISQELIIKIGIQLCDILDYLHHLSPYPILYQDLKPEHIILCGNQLKLIDFGIASFFTGSDNHFQLYGTDGFVAPEALAGQPTTTAADIFGIGKILKFLADASDSRCSDQLRHIIQCATDLLPNRRYPSVSHLKSALLSAHNQPRKQPSHLIRNIAVLSSRPGAGATHIAISLVCTLQKQGIASLYQAADEQDTLGDIARANHYVREQDGIFYYRYFKGIPDYGDGISFSLPFDDCIVRDYGSGSASLATLEAADCILFVLTGSDWDISRAVQHGKQLALLPQTVFLCNHGDKKTAKRYARLLHCPVYCFPNDSDPYKVSLEKEQLFSTILKRKGGHKHFPF